MPLEKIKFINSDNSPEHPSYAIEDMGISRMTLDDVERVNAVINDPSVYNFVRGRFSGVIDVKTILENPNNYVLGHENGVIMFLNIGAAFYEFHTCVLPNGRGAWAQRAGRACFEYMFTRTDAYELITRCPVSNLQSIMLARFMGMKLEFVTRDFWPKDDGLEPMEVYVLSLMEWTSRFSSIEKYGEWLHKRYEEEFVRLSMDVVPHDEDVTHNKYVGAAVLMIRNGQLLKAVAFYNRYALLAGYDPVVITSFDPVILECAGIKLCLTNNDFEVINGSQVQCQQS